MCRSVTEHNICAGVLRNTTYVQECSDASTEHNICEGVLRSTTYVQECSANLLNLFQAA